MQHDGVRIRVLGRMLRDLGRSIDDGVGLDRVRGMCVSLQMVVLWKEIATMMMMIM